MLAHNEPAPVQHSEESLAVGECGRMRTPRVFRWRESDLARFTQVLALSECQP